MQRLGTGLTARWLWKGLQPRRGTGGPLRLPVAYLGRGENGELYGEKCLFLGLTCIISRTVCVNLFFHTVFPLGFEVSP